MIRIAVLDDHPAVLGGLQRLVERAPDLRPVAFVETEAALWHALVERPADIVIVDYDLARGDGLAVCQRLKEHRPGPRVLVYSAYAGSGLAVAARLPESTAWSARASPSPTCSRPSDVWHRATGSFRRSSPTLGRPR
jgi:CheY-like chemotaxis protein